MKPHTEEETRRMMAPGHALTGATAAWVAVCAAEVAGQPIDTPGALLLAGLGAGAALIPDLDHERATIANSFGPLTRLAARGLNALSAAVYAATATALDEERDGGHRGLTHTWPFATLAGVVVATITATIGDPARTATVFLLLCLGMRGLFGPLAERIGWLGTTAVAAGIAWWSVDALPNPAWVWLGGTVTVGCLVHDWGDSLTLMGCPWLWPIRIDGRRWYPVGAPTALRFAAGRETERKVVTPLLVLVATATAVPALAGVWATWERITH